jgi:leucyl-tRNA synthetase
VWDYILLNAKYPEGCGIPEATLSKMKREFNFWYPVDIRVSGKDLITNHLTFALYNHVAFWPEQKNKLPRSMRANGHVLLDGDKMSKSTGNFLTLVDGIEQYSADGMRFALADAGDSLEDANFETKTATAALLRLYVQIKWVDEILAAKDMRTGPPTSFLDRAFAAQIDKAIIETAGHYERTNFREALRTGFYELQGARDAYRINVGNEGMNRDLILRFIEVEALLMAPIIPHFSEYLWSRLGKAGTVRKAAFPTVAKVDQTILEQMSYLETMLHSFRLRRETYMNPKARKGEPATKLAPPTKISITVAKTYPTWMQSVLKIVAPIVESNGNVWPDDKLIVAALKQNPATDPKDKSNKNVMPFVATLKEEFATRGKSTLNLELPFDEKALFEGEAELIKRNLEIQSVEVSYDEAAAKCQPGKPFVSFA